MNHQDTIEAGTRLYERTGAAHESARTDLVAAVLAALRDGEPPTDVAAWSPFTEAYVRKLARTNGIPGYVFRRFPRAKPWMDEQYPSWPGIARAIADLGAGLDDAEYVGGVIYLGLTHKGAENNPAEQRRMIIDRLVRWATRDGADKWRNRVRSTFCAGSLRSEQLSGSAGPVGTRVLPPSWRSSRPCQQGRHLSEPSGQPLPASARGERSRTCADVPADVR
ncbi:MAG: hypothetical protein ACRDNZ_22790 [Streptosporangiaceae bacterium]